MAVFEQHQHNSAGTPALYRIKSAEFSEGVVKMDVSKKQNATQFVVVVIVAVMVACAWLSPFDNKANEQVDAGLKRALATYATARILNGAISVLQGTEIAATPAGVGMTFTPGQILDPLNDLVEQFSQVMLVAMVAFGVEKVLLTVGASWMISLTMSVVAAVWATLYLRHMQWSRWLGRLLLVLLVARFAMPAALMGTDMVFQSFMASDYQESQALLHAVQGEASKLGSVSQDATDKQGFWDRFKSTTVDAFSEARSRLENLKIAAEKAVESVIKLMVIFVLETIVVPLLFIWLLLGIGRGALNIAALPVMFRSHEGAPRSFGYEGLH